MSVQAATVEAHATASAALEVSTATAATVELNKALVAASQIITAAWLRGTIGAALRKLIGDQLAVIVPHIQTYLETALEKGRALGRDQAGDSGTPRRPVPELDDLALLHLIGSSDDRIRKRLADTVELATSLSLTTDADLALVLARANSARQVARTDVSWVVHRAVSLGKAEVALALHMNLVWVAERNACPHCLAYQGHVAAPGQTFPAGLTYADAPIKPYGRLIGPPLHPHCRCQVELTSLAPGEVDHDLAREAARSVARGLTDYQSETGKARSADRLVRDAGRIPGGGQLPKSVVDRARRNVAAGRFAHRPGSVVARREISRRTAQTLARARRSSRV